MVEEGLLSTVKASAAAGDIGKLRKLDFGEVPPPWFFVAQMGNSWRKWATFGLGTSAAGNCHWDCKKRARKVGLCKVSSSFSYFPALINF